MAIATVARIVLARVAWSPAGVLLGIALACAGPILLVAAPIGISSSNIATAEWFYELAIVGSAVGIVLASGVVEQLRPILLRQAAGPRLASEWTVVATSGLAYAAVAALPGFALSAAGFRESLATTAARVLPTIFAAAAASAMLGRLRLPRALAPWFLAGGMLLAPIVLRSPVEAPRHLALALAFGLGAWLLDHPPGGAR